MRVSRAQAEQNHEAVVNAASRLFREHGFDGIGLEDLMKGAGLTQGGFYKQFASEEDLIAQASRRAMEMATRHWSDAIVANPTAALEAATREVRRIAKMARSSRRGARPVSQAAARRAPDREKSHQGSTGRS